MEQKALMLRKRHHNDCEDSGIPPMKLSAMCVYAASNLPSTSYPNIVPVILVEPIEEAAKVAFKKVCILVCILFLLIAIYSKKNFYFLFT